MDPFHPDHIFSDAFPPPFDPDNLFGDAPSSGGDSGDGPRPNGPPGDSSVDIGPKPPSGAPNHGGPSSSDIVFRPDSTTSHSGDSTGGDGPHRPNAGGTDSSFRPETPLKPTAPANYADIDGTVSAGPHGGGGGHTPGKIAKLGGLLDVVQVVEGVYRDGAEIVTGQPNEGVINPAIQGTQVGNALNNVAQATPITTGAIQTIEHHGGHTLAAAVSVVATPVQVGELTFNGGVKIGQNIANRLDYTDNFVNGLERLGVVDAVVAASDFVDDVTDFFGLGRAPAAVAAVPAGPPGLVSAIAFADVLPPAPDAPQGGGVSVDQVW